MQDHRSGWASVALELHWKEKGIHMASVTIMKHTFQAASAGQVRHVYREGKQHSNPDIKSEYSAKSNYYFWNAQTARKAIRYMVNEIDSRIPPKQVKKDRKTVAELCFPAPRDGMTGEQADDFFSALWTELLKEKDFHVVGGAVHGDEVHNYIDPDDKQVHQSRIHMHILVVPETDKGCNMKSWLTRERYRSMNAIADRVCEQVLGYPYQDGTRARTRGAVESLKVASSIEAAQQEQERMKRARELEQNAVETVQKAHKAVLALSDDKKHLEGEINALQAFKRVLEGNPVNVPYKKALIGDKVTLSSNDFDTLRAQAGRVQAAELEVKQQADRAIRAEHRADNAEQTVQKQVQEKSFALAGEYEETIKALQVQVQDLANRLSDLTLLRDWLLRNDKMSEKEIADAVAHQQFYKCFGFEIVSDKNWTPSDEAEKVETFQTSQKRTLERWRDDLDIEL